MNPARPRRCAETGRKRIVAYGFGLIRYNTLRASPIEDVVNGSGGVAIIGKGFFC